MSYVDGFVLPAPKANLPAYRRMAKKADGGLFLDRARSAISALRVEATRTRPPLIGAGHGSFSPPVQAPRLTQ